MTKSRFDYFDYFRAIAIIIIVAGHSLKGSFVDSDATLFLFNLINGGTALFVFISGFFFHAVFYSKFHYKSFLWKKIQSVYVPFIFMSCAAIFFRIVINGSIEYAPLSDPNVTGLLTYLHYFNFLFFGLSFGAYWYIPFAMALFLLSPLFISFIKASTLFQLILIGTSFLVAMWLQRPADFLLLHHHLIFYIGFYLLGIFYSMYRVEFEKLLSLKNSVAATALSLVLVTYLMVVLDQAGGGVREDYLAWQGLSLYPVQKIFLISLLLSVTLKIGMKNKPSNSLKYIAETSFAIFFIHPWTISFADRLVFKTDLQTLPNFLGLFIVALTFAVLITWLAKRLMSERSKYLIGY